MAGSGKRKGCSADQLRSSGFRLVFPLPKHVVNVVCLYVPITLMLNPHHIEAEPTLHHEWLVEVVQRKCSWQEAQTMTLQTVASTAVDHVQSGAAGEPAAATEMPLR